MGRETTKIAHWSFMNGSGLSTVAAEMAASEKEFGFNSVHMNTDEPKTWDAGMDADIHIAHSHIPDQIIQNADRKSKVITFQHGTPEHIFQWSLDNGLRKDYGVGDSLAMSTFMLKRADAVATFWGRHAEIWATMTDKPVFVVPMGSDSKFWVKNPDAAGGSGGDPSVLTAENCHPVKWPLDMLLAWPWIIKKIPTAKIHIINIPMDQHRWWIPLAYANGSMYSSMISPSKLPKPMLRDFFSFFNFYLSPARYGDFNKISMEAHMIGCATISFRGNEYAEYWLEEGDQRRQAEQMIEILRGNIPPRQTLKSPRLEDQLFGMVQIYDYLLTGKMPAREEESCNSEIVEVTLSKDVESAEPLSVNAHVQMPTKLNDIAYVKDVEPYATSILSETTPKLRKRRSSKRVVKSENIATSETMSS